MNHNPPAPPQKSGKHVRITVAMATKSLKSLQQRIARAIVTGSRSAKLLFARDKLLLCWLEDGVVGRNWGDKLNPVLVSRLSSKEVVQARNVFNIRGQPVYYVIGSGLGARLSPHAVVWGQGFNCFNDCVLQKQMQVRAVRGPLSREKLLDVRVPCPDTYGDPALLMPWLFNPKVSKTYEIGLIPHFSHQKLPFFSNPRSEGVLTIDITGDLYRVVEQVKSCKLIASSSLHGLIIADAYGVPSKWLTVDDLPIGDGFKFKDHFAAVGREGSRPLSVDGSMQMAEIVDSYSDYVVPRIPDMRSLLMACPFLDQKLPIMKPEETAHSYGS